MFTVLCVLVHLHLWKKVASTFFRTSFVFHGIKKFQWGNSIFFPLLIKSSLRSSFIKCLCYFWIDETLQHSQMWLKLEFTEKYLAKHFYCILPLNSVKSKEYVYVPFIENCQGGNMLKRWKVSGASFKCLSNTV